MTVCNFEVSRMKNSRCNEKSKGPRQADLLFLVFQEEKPSPCGATVGYLYQ